MYYFIVNPASKTGVGAKYWKRVEKVLEEKKIAYQVMTQGYPQTSGLLTNAYGEYVYVYFFENTTPGKLRVLRDKSGQTHADYITKEDLYMI